MESSKKIIGKLIDNDSESQITYEYGGSDNLITIHLDKINKELNFTWNFTQPVFPFIKFENSDVINVKLYSDENVQKIQNIIDNLKKEKFEEI